MPLQLYLPMIQIMQKNDFLKSEVEEGLVTSLTKNFSGLSTGLDATLKKQTHYFIV